MYVGFLEHGFMFEKVSRINERPSIDTKMSLKFYASGKDRHEAHRVMFLQYLYFELSVDCVLLREENIYP
jgi:hypothetical protein